MVKLAVCESDIFAVIQHSHEELLHAGVDKLYDRISFICQFFTFFLFLIYYFDLYFLYIYIIYLV